CRRAPRFPGTSRGRYRPGGEREHRRGSMRRGIVCVLGLLLTAAGPSLAASDDEIRDRMIAESIAACRGPCPCPYNVMRNDKSCGGFSAWSKLGGAESLCFREDITEE